MGYCCFRSSPAESPTPVTSNLSTERISRTTATTTNTTSSGVSNFSKDSHFSASGGEAFPDGHILPDPNLRIFTFAKLRAATKSFRPDTVLGEGGFGKVYKGWLDEKLSSRMGGGSVVAVKKLNSQSLQGYEEWRSEVNFLGRLSNPNLVKLMGYCLEDKELLLVYEFMQKGSLENHLFGRGSTVQPLPWNLRLKIAIGAAHGLAFLHQSERQVIYRDFKSSNILLDGVRLPPPDLIHWYSMHQSQSDNFAIFQSYNAKLSDFGLAKVGPSASRSHITTRVMGTNGYAAPEYVSTGHLYVKSDVYAFGVVLVEMLTGLRALDQNRPSGRHNLVDWIKPVLSSRRKLKNIMDSHLEGRYPSKTVFQVAQLALKCLEPEPRSRPSMKDVLETLQQLEDTSERTMEPKVRSNNHRIAHGQGQEPLHLRPYSNRRAYQNSPRD
ncbi:hypothetical protein SAY87_000266 [Trapa incisa]|uniref:non-specific serine/threonine protein kinase n=1 Tax=Trapa incisa TaxID=236973 RepID=A0AAN7GBG3_9MYRT|nr:hypothetical protein SAY87_000266 [Trapa incisa]